MLSYQQKQLVFFKNYKDQQTIFNKQQIYQEVQQYQQYKPIYRDFDENSSSSEEDKSKQCQEVTQKKKKKKNSNCQQVSQDISQQQKQVKDTFQNQGNQLHKAQSDDPSIHQIIIQNFHIPSIQDIDISDQEQQQQQDNHQQDEKQKHSNQQDNIYMEEQKIINPQNNEKQNNQLTYKQQLFQKAYAQTEQTKLPELEHAKQFFIKKKQQYFDEERLLIKEAFTVMKKKSPNTYPIIKQLWRKINSQQQLSSGFQAKNLSSLKILFQFSSPHVIVKEQNVKAIEEINFSKELSSLIQSVKQSKINTKFLISNATVEKFSESLNQNPDIIHFCGHGYSNGDEDYLVFEDDNSQVHCFYQHDLEELLKVHQNSIKLVFLASCHSKEIGDVFLQYGATHVICVLREEKILDKACLEFSQQFYKALFEGKKTVCQAFKIAKSHLKIYKKFRVGEENKFILLTKGCQSAQSILNSNTTKNSLLITSDNQSDQSNEDDFFDFNDQSDLEENKCQVFTKESYKKGKIHYTKSLPFFNKIPSYNSDLFFGREQESYELIQTLNNHRIIVINGEQGIGKSCFLKHILRYLYDRNQFEDGVFYVDVEDCKTVNELKELLQDNFSQMNQKPTQFNSFNINKVSSNISTQSSDSLQMLEDNIVNKQLLIALDNCDSLMNKCKLEFTKYIHLLEIQYSQVKILITANCLVSTVEKIDIYLFPFKLKGLSQYYSRLLFFRKSPRQVKVSELDDFLSPKNFYSKSSKEKQEKKPKVMLKISQHEFFDKFRGNPRLIIKAAEMLDQYTLTQLYTLKLICSGLHVNGKQYLKLINGVNN